MFPLALLKQALLTKKLLFKETSNGSGTQGPLCPFKRMLRFHSGHPCYP